MNSSLVTRHLSLDSFICPYCQTRNYRQHAGADRCEICQAEVVTTGQVWEGDPFRILYSKPPPALSAAQEVRLPA